MSKIYVCTVIAHKDNSLWTSLGVRTGEWEDLVKSDFLNQIRTTEFPFNGGWNAHTPYLIEVTPDLLLRGGYVMSDSDVYRNPLYLATQREASLKVFGVTSVAFKDGGWRVITSTLLATSQALAMVNSLEEARNINAPKSEGWGCHASYAIEITKEVILQAGYVRS